MKLGENPSQAEETTKEKVSPFYQGFIWGITVTLVVVISATAGAAVTMISPPLFERIQLLLQKLPKNSTSSTSRNYETNSTRNNYSVINTNLGGSNRDAHSDRPS